MKTVTCEFIATRRGIDRAIVAEELRKTNLLSKCSNCEKYHLWGPGINQDQARTSIEARLAFYVQVGPNRFVKIDNKRKNKKNDEQDA